MEHKFLTVAPYAETPVPDDIDLLHDRVRALIDTPPDGSERDAWERHLAISKIADCRGTIATGLDSEDQSYKALALINDFTRVAGPQPYEQGGVLSRTARTLLARTVWNNSDTIIRLVTGSDADTATLAQVVLFKAMCEPAPFPRGSTQDNQLLDTLLHTLPGAITASQREDPRSVQNEQLRKLTSRLLTTGDSGRTTDALGAIEQITTASPEVQNLGWTMRGYARELIEEEYPDSNEEFAYKIQVTQLLDTLRESDRIGQRTLDGLSITITELDTAGKENGWNSALWDEIETLVLEVGGAQHNGRIAAMLLAHYGLNYGEMRKAWVIGSGRERTDPKFVERCDEHLKRIIDLERIRPGAARKLSLPPYGLRNFARVPLEALVVQYDAIKDPDRKPEKYALIGLGICETPRSPYDNSNGALSPKAELRLWENLYREATRHGITPLFHEGDAVQLAAVLNTARRKYGKPAEFGLGKWHNSEVPAGASAFALIGHGTGPRYTPTTDEIRQLAQGKTKQGEIRRQRLREAIRMGGEIVLIACHAGEQDNTAAALHKAIGRVVAGPHESTTGFISDKVRVVQNPYGGGHQLIFDYEAEGGGRVPTARYS